MLTKKLRIFVAIAVCANPISAIQAAFFETRSEPVRLYFSEGESGVMRVGDASTPSKPIDPGSAILLRRNEEANIIIADPNPLLFSYTPGKITTTPTASFLVIQNIISTLPPTSMGVAPDGAESAVRVPTRTIVELGGIDIQTFREKYNELGNNVGQIKTLIDRTLNMDPAEIARVKTEVNEWNVDALETIIRDGLSKTGALLRSKASGQTVDARFSDGSIMPVNLITFDGVSPEAKTSIQQFLSQLEDSQTVLANLDILLEFANAVSGLNQEIPLSQIGFNVQANQTIGIIVSPVPTFQRLMSDTARIYQTRLAGDKGRTYKIQIKPYQRFHFSAAPGVMVSSVSRREFTAVDPQGNGTFQVGVESDKTGFDEIIPAIALNITHDMFFGEALEPFFQIGVAPSSGDLAFLFGLGMSAYKQFTLAAGAVFQEVQALPAGVKIGDPIKPVPATALNLESEFKLGFYLNLSFELQPKKTN